MASEARPGVNDGDENGIAGVLLELLDRRPAWHADALCREYAGRVTFFPNRGQPLKPARDLCRSCLVRDECEAWALDQGDDLEGIWGGLTQQDRRKRRAAPEHAVDDAELTQAMRFITAEFEVPQAHRSGSPYSR